jgi:short-subunit dehydrogenase
VVNISSLAGLLAMPSLSGYTASKFAVRGFTESLSQELAMARLPVRATCVHPGGIKTGIAKSARMSASVAELGLDERGSAQAFERMFSTTPEQAARVILSGVRKNRRRVLVGLDAHLLDLLVRFMPSLYQRLAVLVARRAVSGRPSVEAAAAGSSVARRAAK